MFEINEAFWLLKAISQWSRTSLRSFHEAPLWCHNLTVPVSSPCSLLPGQVLFFNSPDLPCSSLPPDALRLSFLSPLPDCPTLIHTCSHFPHLLCNYLDILTCISWLISHTPFKPVPFLWLIVSSSVVSCASFLVLLFIYLLAYLSTSACLFAYLPINYHLHWTKI